MSKVKVDIVVAIKFDINDDSKTCIYTNARTDNDALEDILSTWLQGQIGQGDDPNKAIERPLYTIKLGLILEDDTFCVESDTGNKGLTCGLVLETFQKLKTLTIKPLAELPA